MLKALWERIWGVSDTVATKTHRGYRDEDFDSHGRTWQERCDFLQGQINRLRGRVTGGDRATQDDPGSTNGPPPGSGVSPATWARLDPAARERLLNRRTRAVQNG